MSRDATRRAVRAGRADLVRVLGMERLAQDLRAAVLRLLRVLLRRRAHVLDLEKAVDRAPQQPAAAAAAAARGVTGAAAILAGRRRSILLHWQPPREAHQRDAPVLDHLRGRDRARRVRLAALLVGLEGGGAFFSPAAHRTHHIAHWTGMHKQHTPLALVSLVSLPRLLLSAGTGVPPDDSDGAASSGSNLRRSRVRVWGSG